MAKRLYENLAGGLDLNLFIDPVIYSQVADTDRLNIITEFQALSTDARTAQSILAGYTNLEDYDEALEIEEWDVRDRLDYYSLYSNRVQELVVRDGAWFSPDSVQSVLAEDTGLEAFKSIDGNSNTFWRDSQNHQHVITYQLRNYPKKISKIRFWYGASGSARERLNDMDVHAANAVPNLDNPENILETGINITWPGVAEAGWVEHTLAKKKNKARFVKLIINGTDNGSNQIQIREFEVWVETTDPL